jgi:hypothetical protein
MTDPQEFVLHVNALGELVFVYADELADLLNLGEFVVARASHVEPLKMLDGRQCWTADLSPVNGPHLGPYDLRSHALDAERHWLETNLV